MQSILASLGVLTLICWLDARPAHGQPALKLEIRVSDGISEACLSEPSLSERVAHYRSSTPSPRGLELRLYVTGADTAELQIVRGGSVVSRRSFTQLPATCADRRDAVALSIALAMERTAAAAPQRAARATTGSRAPSARGAGDSRAALSPAQGDASEGGRSEDAAAEDDRADAQQPTAQDLPVPPAQPMPSAGVQDSPEESSAQTPIVLGSMPTTTSRDPRQKGDKPSSLQLQLGGRHTIEAVPTAVWVGTLAIELPITGAVTLGITALLSSTGEAALAGARARASFLGVEAVGCSNVPLSVFMMQLCGGAGVALCEVSGREYPRARPDATLLWAAILGRATLRWPREGWLAARLVLQPHVSLSRPDLRVEGSSERLRSFWMGGSAGLELWLALP